MSILMILMKFEFSWQIFKKYTNIKFHKNPPSGSQVPDGQTDRLYEANTFCSSTNMPKEAFSESDFWVSFVH
jgi:hypothetical protein